MDAECPDRLTIDCAAGIMDRGGVIVFPTLGLYGLGADALNPRAVQRIFDLKGRQRNKPLLVMVADMPGLEQAARRPSAAALHLMRHFWPGKVTFVLPARRGLPQALTGGSPKIGVRIPGHPVAAALVKTLGRPITGTSANLAGAGGCSDIKQLAPALAAGVDAILDAGPLTGGKGSSVVDLCGAVPEIIREGAVSAAAILAVFDQYRRSRL